jgi:hypothetical protein
VEGQFRVAVNTSFSSQQIVERGPRVYYFSRKCKEWRHKFSHTRDFTAKQPNLECPELHQFLTESAKKYFARLEALSQILKYFEVGQHSRDECLSNYVAPMLCNLLAEMKGGR